MLLTSHCACMWVFTLDTELSLVLLNTVKCWNQVRVMVSFISLLGYMGCEAKLQNWDFQGLWLLHILSEKEGAAQIKLLADFPDVLYSGSRIQPLSRKEGKTGGSNGAQAGMRCC